VIVIKVLFTMIRFAAYMYCFDNVNIRRMKLIFDLCIIKI